MDNLTELVEDTLSPSSESISSGTGRSQIKKPKSSKKAASFRRGAGNASLRASLRVEELRTIENSGSPWWSLAVPMGADGLNGGMLQSVTDMGSPGTEPEVSSGSVKETGISATYAGSSAAEPVVEDASSQSKVANFTAVNTVTLTDEDAGSTSNVTVFLAGMDEDSVTSPQMIKNVSNLKEFSKQDLISLKEFLLLSKGSNASLINTDLLSVPSSGSLNQAEMAKLMEISKRLELARVNNVEAGVSTEDFDGLQNAYSTGIRESDKNVSGLEVSNADEVGNAHAERGSGTNFRGKFSIGSMDEEVEEYPNLKLQNTQFGCNEIFEPNHSPCGAERTTSELPERVFINPAQLLETETRDAFEEGNPDVESVTARVFVPMESSDLWNSRGARLGISTRAEFVRIDRVDDSDDEYENRVDRIRVPVISNVVEMPAVASSVVNAVNFDERDHVGVDFERPKGSVDFVGRDNKSVDFEGQENASDRSRVFEPLKTQNVGSAKGTGGEFSKVEQDTSRKAAKSASNKVAALAKMFEVGKKNKNDSEGESDVMKERGARSSEVENGNKIVGEGRGEGEIGRGEGENADEDGSTRAPLTAKSHVFSRRPVVPRQFVEDTCQNVRVLTCPSSSSSANADESGICQVYVIGTAHVSKESCDDVRRIIRLVKPEVVFVEVCSDRIALLMPQKEIQVPTFSEMLHVWRQKKSNAFAVVYSWMLAKIAEKMDVFPGAEFRAAYEEAMACGALVKLGDRPVQITLRRTWGRMSLWHKVKLISMMLVSAFWLPSQEEFNKLMEEMKQTDMLTLAVKDMSQAFPTLVETLLDERDQYMSVMLRNMAEKTSCVVAVVGKGHQEGIAKYWGRNDIDVKSLLQLPPERKPWIRNKWHKYAICVLVVGCIGGVYAALKAKPSEGTT